MSNFPKQPYLELVTKPKDRIGIAECEVCGRGNEVRVDASGNLYSFCYGAGGCGGGGVKKGQAASQALIGRMISWDRGVKRRLMVLAGLKEPKTEAPDIIEAAKAKIEAKSPPGETKKIPSQPEETAPDKKTKKEPFMKLAIFGKEL